MVETDEVVVRIAATGFRGGLDDVAVCSGVVADDRLMAIYAAAVLDG